MPSRRSFLAAASAIGAVGAQTPGARPVNIVYLHSHDSGRYLQPYGHPVVTPNLQKLATEGVVGTKFVGDAENPAGATVMFNLDDGLVLSLYPRSELAKDASQAMPQSPDCWHRLDSMIHPAHCPSERNLTLLARPTPVAPHNPNRRMSCPSESVRPAIRQTGCCEMGPAVLRY